MSARSTRTTVLAAALSGLLMAVYLLLRPYGDAAGATSADAAQAFGSVAWVVAHACGMLALGAYALTAHRLTRGDSGRVARITDTAAVAGAFLVQPYYGAEAFGLHALGVGAASQPEVLGLVSVVRDNAVAMSLFAVGLLALAVSAVALGLTLTRRGYARWAVWPLAVAMALFVPQFYLPPVGRMAFGVAYLGASLLLARSIVGVGSGATVPAGAGGAGPTVPGHEHPSVPAGEAR